MMNLQMFSQSDEERLFLSAVDGALSAPDAAAFEEALRNSPALRERFERHRRAVSLLKGSRRESAPPMLAAQILRRTRRRRFGARRAVESAQADYRLPVEIIVPILVGVLAAVVILFAAR